MDPGLQFSENQKLFLLVSNICYEAISVFDVLFVVHNIYKYVIGLKMDKPLIWVFYILLLLLTILNTIEFYYQIRYPEVDNKFAGYSDDRVGFFAIQVGVGVVVTLILTVHKLELALKLILGQISLNGMKRAACIVKATLLTFSGVFVVAIYTIWYKEQGDAGYQMDVVNYVFGGFNVFLTFCYLVAILRLNRVMMKIGEDFNQQKRSVNFQFYTFLFVELAFFMELVLFQFRKLNSTAFIIDQLVCAILLKILPTTVFLVLHYKAFSPRTIQRNSSHTSDTGKRIIKTSNFDFITESDIQTSLRESQLDNDAQIQLLGTQDKAEEIGSRGSVKSQSLYLSQYLLQTTQGFQFQDAIRRKRNSQ